MINRTRAAMLIIVVINSSLGASGFTNFEVYVILRDSLQLSDK